MNHACPVITQGRLVIAKQPKPRDWCNCNATLFLRRCERRETSDEREQERISNEIGSVTYAHETGRCRFEYDPNEQPIGVTDDGLG